MNDINVRSTHKQEQIARLDRVAAGLWDEILSTSPVFAAVDAGRVDRKFFALYMLETYQYTLHNARNQALVGVRTLSARPQYVQFCFQHAAEETGHELMALHDFKTLWPEGASFEIPQPLVETEVLIAYLYWISATGNPLQRMGYSFWAESSYKYIMPKLRRLQECLGLSRHQLTFFIAHSDIDAKHAEEIERELSQNCETDADWQAVERVMTTSLRLTGRFLDGVWAEYQRLLADAPSVYAFLNAHL